MTATSSASRVSAICGGERPAIAQEGFAGAARELLDASEQRRRGPRGAKRLDRRAGCGKRIERNIDAVEIAIVLAAILQVIDDLQRRAQHVVTGPARGFRHERRARSARPAWRNSGNSQSDRPSPRSAAWSRPCRNAVSRSWRVARCEMAFGKLHCAAQRLPVRRRCGRVRVASKTSRSCELFVGGNVG